jgi:hypothetical protein
MDKIAKRETNGRDEEVQLTTNSHFCHGLLISSLPITLFAIVSVAADKQVRHGFHAGITCMVQARQPKAGFQRFKQ